MTAYRIKKWLERHSNFEQQRSGGKWIACPVKFDSLALRVLLREKNGPAYFGCYVLIAELAARMPVPGLLADEKGAMDAVSIAIVTGASEKVLGAALDRLSAPDIAWIDRVPTPVFDRTVAGTSPDASVSSHERAFAAAANQPTSPAGGPGEKLPDPVLAAIVGRMKGAKKHIDAIACSGVSPVGVIAMWHDISKDPDVRSHLGAMAHRLAVGEAPPKLTREALLAALKSHLVLSVNGNEIVADATFGWNDQGILANGKFIVLTKELASAQLG